jgi:hypothetical protein
VPISSRSAGGGEKGEEDRSKDAADREDFLTRKISDLKRKQGKMKKTMAEANKKNQASVAALVSEMAEYRRTIQKYKDSLREEGRNLVHSQEAYQLKHDKHVESLQYKHELSMKEQITRNRALEHSISINEGAKSLERYTAQRDGEPSTAAASLEGRVRGRQKQTRGHLDAALQCQE